MIAGRGAGKLIRLSENRVGRWAAVAVATAIAVAVAASRAAAQGCAMCYQSAAASAAPGREALRHGILLLLVPAISLFLGIFAFIYRRRNFAR
jgi:hypothetical protein